MEQALKSKKLGSALARRKKIQQREVADHEMEEKRMKVLLYGYASEEEDLSDDEDRGNTLTSVSDSDIDHSVTSGTVSENDPRTPNEASSPSSIPGDETTPAISFTAVDLDLNMPQFHTFSQMDGKDTKEVVHVGRSASMRALVRSRLLDPSDFMFDRYSTIVTSLELPDPDTTSLHSPTAPPVEIARPVQYSSPQTRPSMISIRNPALPSIKSDSSTSVRILSPRGPSVPTQITARQMATLSVKSSHHVCGATPGEVGPPLPPPEVITKITSIAEESMGLPSTPHQKSNLLFDMAASRRHPRVKGIKEVVKDSVSSRSATQSALPPLNFRPLTPLMDINASDTPASGPEPSLAGRDLAVQMRPRTATPPSFGTGPTKDLTALPIPEGTSSDGGVGLVSSSADPAGPRSVLGFRARGDSLSHVLKSASSNIKSRARLAGKLTIHNSGAGASRKISVDSACLPRPPSPLGQHHPRVAIAAGSTNLGLRAMSSRMRLKVQG